MPYQAEGYEIVRDATIAVLDQEIEGLTVTAGRRMAVDKNQETFPVATVTVGSVRAIADTTRQRQFQRQASLEILVYLDAVEIAEESNDIAIRDSHIDVELDAYMRNIIAAVEKNNQGSGFPENPATNFYGIAEVAFVSADKPLLSGGADMDVATVRLNFSVSYSQSRTDDELVAEFEGQEIDFERRS